MIRKATAPLLLVLLLAAIPIAAAAAAAPHAFTVAFAHSKTPVLGKKGLYAPYGKGWGQAHPRVLDNGGDPSGIVTKITWKNWGSSSSYGHGLGNGPKPGGGYYRKHVTVQFKAADISTCSAHGPQAYTHLRARFQKKPGSTHWTRWFNWGGLRTVCSR